MSTAPPNPPPSPSSSVTPPPRKSGCGRGCLKGCLGMVVLGLLAVIIGVVVAKPMLQSRWEQWRATHPEAAKLVVAALPMIKGVAAGLASKGETSDTSSGKPTPPKRLEGINDKNAMPADLPVWPRAKAETYSVGQEHAAGFQRVKVRSDSVLRFYRRVMPEKGWQLTAEQKGAGAALLLYKKGQRVARVEVVGSDTALTEIWLRSRLLQPPKPK